MAEQDTLTPSNGAGGPQSLQEAILAVQAEAPKLPLDGKNPHFNSRFTKLATMVEVVGPLLTKYRLTWTTKPCRDAHGEPALKYRLVFVPTGEVDEDTMPLLLTKNDPQGLGSAITYGRRYALACALDLVADEDDDGSRARSRAKPQTQPQEPPANAIPKERQIEIAKGIGALGLTYGQVDQLLGSAGIDGLRAASKKALTERLETLTPEDADAVDKELEKVAAQE